MAYAIALPCLGKGIEIVLENLKVFHGAFFSEGVSWAADKSGFYHIDKEGRSLYRQRYDWTEGFHEGLAEARKDGKRFHIRKDGTPAYQERFDEVGFFRNGTAPVVLNGESFRINHEGKRVA